jgi:ectoine hydroxylase-related dioxygenase (phytanoyl-CoA dioxygenase family)
LKYPEMARLAEDQRMLKMASEVLGDQAFPYRAIVFDKSPTANWLVAWHQDKALPVREKRAVPGWGPWSVKNGVLYANGPAAALAKVVALRLHFDDSTHDNGPLKVLPGTHRLGLLSDAEIRRLSRTILARECLVACGGVIAMSPLILHASSKSKGNLPRRVLHVEYAADRNIDTGLELVSG